MVWCLPFYPATKWLSWASPSSSVNNKQPRNQAQRWLRSSSISSSSSSSISSSSSRIIIIIIIIIVFKSIPIPSFTSQSFLITSLNWQRPGIASHPDHSEHRNDVSKIDSKSTLATFLVPISWPNSFMIQFLWGLLLNWFCVLQDLAMGKGSDARGLQETLQETSCSSPKTATLLKHVWGIIPAANIHHKVPAASFYHGHWELEIQNDSKRDALNSRRSGKIMLHSWC